MFRFCRVIEDKGRQYLLRAANHTCFVGLGQLPGPASALTIETWMSDGGDWDNMRMVLNLPDQVVMLMALECFTKEHAREAFRLLAATHRQQLTSQEQLAGAQQLGESVVSAIRQRYGSVG